MGHVGGHRVAVQRIRPGRPIVHGRRLAGGGYEGQPGQAGGVVGGQPGPPRMPGETVPGRGLPRVLHHLDPEDPEPGPVELAAERPPPPVQRRLAVTGLEGRRAARRSPVEQREAVPGLEERGVVGEPGPVEAGRQARVIDERVLEEPQPTVGPERIDVLVVPSEDRSDPPGEEGFQRTGLAGGGAADVGGDVTRRGGARGRRPGRGRRRTAGDKPADQERGPHEAGRSAVSAPRSPSPTRPRALSHVPPPTVEGSRPARRGVPPWCHPADPGSHRGRGR